MMKRDRMMLLAVLVACSCGNAATSAGVGGTSEGSSGMMGPTGTGASGTGASGTASTGIGGAGASTGVGTGGAGTASTGTSMTSTGTGTTSSGGCTVTLSGAETGTFSCAVSAAWAGGNNVTGVAFTPASALPTGVETAEGGGTVSGQIMAMTYPLSSFVMGGYAVVSDTQTAWESPPTGTSGGTQSMTITSVTTDIDTSTGKTYTLHGTFDATCPYQNGTPDPGTSVTVHIDF